MKQFSHTKLQVFERCPLQYKLKYISRLKPVREDTIEAFMGGCVHGTLELLYRDLLKTKVNSLANLLEFYDKTWQVEWNDEIKITNPDYNKEHYYNLGKKCIENYYNKYAPFDQDQTIGIEKKVSLKWGDYEIIGYIDRLTREKDGIYAVHDYKTNSSIFTQDYADKDRQLGLYAAFVRQEIKEAKDVKLVWHFVAFGEDVKSDRQEKQLKELKNNVLELIEEINTAEKEDKFPAKETKCDWCGFWQFCPKKKHLFEVKDLPQNKYLEEDGVKLANKYIDLTGQKAQINKKARADVTLVEEEMAKVEEAILQYAKKNKVEILYGETSLVAINKSEEYAIPTKTNEPENFEKLEKLLKGTKYWDDASVFNATKIKQMLEDGVFDEKIKAEIIKLAPLETELSLSVRKKQ